jgi:hypothetical protein
VALRARRYGCDGLGDRKVARKRGSAWPDQARGLAISYRQVRGLWEAPCLLERRPMAAQWFKVTNPEGKPVWLNPEDCSRVRIADGSVAEGSVSIIEGGFGIQAVKETVEMIMKILRKC